MVTFWPRQSAEFTAIANDHAMETLHKACLAGLDAVLHHIVVETTGQKNQQQSIDGTSMLESIRSSLDRLNNTNHVNNRTQLSDMLKEADLLLLDDRCLLTTATHAHLGRALVHVLRYLGRSTDYPSCSASLDFAETRHNLLTALEETPAMLDRSTSLLRHVLVHDEEQEPPAYYSSHSDYTVLPDDAKPPQYDDELDRIMNALSRLSVQYNNQRVDTSHHREHTRSLTDLLAKSLHRPGFSRQRFALSDAKERDLFMNGLFHKVDRLQGRRLSNQDAEPPRDDLDTLVHHIARAKRSRLDNQCAAFSCPFSA